MRCGRLVVRAQKLMQAVVGRAITGEPIRRISAGFVMQGDSTKQEITRCLGTRPVRRTAVTMEGRAAGSPPLRQQSPRAAIPKQRQGISLEELTCSGLGWGMTRTEMSTDPAPPLALGLLWEGAALRRSWAARYLP